MELNNKVASAFSAQITLELEASIVYLQLAIELEDRDLTGMATWMRLQSDEERVHAAKFIQHVTDRNNRPQTGNVSSPSAHFNSVLEVFEASLTHEERVSEAIRELYRLAQAEGDLDSIPLLNWFLEEQIEEEATVGEIVGRLKMIGDDGSGLLRLDAELGSRTGTDQAR